MSFSIHFHACASCTPCVSLALFTVCCVSLPTHPQGKNYSVNFPLKDGIDDESFMMIFDQVMAKVMVMVMLMMMMMRHRTHPKPTPAPVTPPPSTHAGHVTVPARCNCAAGWLCVCVCVRVFVCVFVCARAPVHMNLFNLHDNSVERTP